MSYYSRIFIAPLIYTHAHKGYRAHYIEFSTTLGFLTRSVLYVCVRARWGAQVEIPVGANEFKWVVNGEWYTSPEVFQYSAIMSPSPFFLSLPFLFLWLSQQAAPLLLFCSFDMLSYAAVCVAYADVFALSAVRQRGRRPRNIRQQLSLHSRPPGSSTPSTTALS